MRIRTIKPEFWMHEGLCSVSEFSRLLALALLNWADDEGYFMANPILLRSQLFPFLDDSTKVPRSLQDLSKAGWIRLGKDNQGRSIGNVLNFAKHQRVDKPKPSEIKASWQFVDESKNDPIQIPDGSKEERKGMEGNEEGNGNEPLSATADVSYPEIIETMWSAFPAKCRDRSSRAKVSKAWFAAKRRPSDDVVLSSLRKWAVCHDWTKDGGQFAPGAHIWIKDRKWESDPLAGSGKPAGGNHAGIGQKNFTGDEF